VNSQFTLLSLVFSLFVVGTVSYSFAETNSVDVFENKMVTLVGKGIDADSSDVLTFEWQQIDGESVTLSSYTVAEPEFMAPDVLNGQVKVLTFTLKVTDPFGESSTDTVEVVVNPVNHAPYVNAGKDQVTFNTINAVTFVSSAVDQDGDSLTYNWKQVAGQPLELSSTTGKYLTILPMYIDYSQSNPLTFELTVNDGFGGSASDTVSVYPLTDVLSNRLISIQVTPLQVVKEGEQVTISATGETANGASISYSWIQLIGSEVKLDAYTGPTVQFTAPDLPDDHEMVLSFQVMGHSAGNGWASALALVKVIPSNSPPVADAGPDQSVAKNVQVKLIGSGTDPDNDNIRYSWAQKSGMNVELYERATFSVYFFTPSVMPDSEELVFELTVTDSYGNSDTDDVVVTVNSVNLPPRAFAGPDRKIIGDSDVTVVGTGTDPENAPLTYSWKQISGETVSFDNTDASISFNAPSVVSGESKRLVFQLTVTDSVNQSASDQVILIVVAENSAPTVDAGADVIADENTSLGLVCTAYDPDNDAVSFSWTSSNSDVMIVDAMSPRTTIQIPSVLNDQPITMTCTASDGRLSGSDSMVINVNNVLNLAIIADAGADQTVNENVPIALDGSNSSDPENQKLSYMWTQLSGEAVTLSSPSSVTPSFTSPVVANGEVKVLTFELRVYDDNGREDTDSVTITVDPLNSPPEAIASAKQN
jgi:hypothetical protein